VKGVKVDRDKGVNDQRRLRQCQLLSEGSEGEIEGRKHGAYEWMIIRVWNIRLYIIRIMIYSRWALMKKGNRKSRTFDDPRSTLAVGRSLPLFCLSPLDRDRGRCVVEYGRGNYLSRPRKCLLVRDASRQRRLLVRRRVQGRVFVLGIPRCCREDAWIGC